jgi:hypothetical protein
MSDVSFDFLLYPHHRASIHVRRGEASLVQKVATYLDSGSALVLDPIGGPGDRDIDPALTFRTITIKPYTENGDSKIRKNEDWENSGKYGFTFAIDDRGGDLDWNDCFVDVTLSYERAKSQF